MRRQLPILFTTMMVEPTKARRKTMTRRMTGLDEINENPNDWKFSHFSILMDGNMYAFFEYKNTLEHVYLRCPYGNKGAILYVRENWFPAAINGNKVLIAVNKDDTNESWEIETKDPGPYWKKLNRGCMIPSIHMPKEASRIWLEVTDIRVERLQDITEDDAIAEGIDAFRPVPGDGPAQTMYRHYLKNKWGPSPVHSFQTLWQMINGEDSWKANPWVWVVSFKVLSTTGKPDNLN